MVKIFLRICWPFIRLPRLRKRHRRRNRFEAGLGDKYPAIGPSWRADWDRLTALFYFPPAIRKEIYTTNAIESLNYSLRKVLK